MAEQAVSMDLNYWKLQMVLKAVFLELYYG